MAFERGILDDDHFYRLPDSLVLVIFDKVADVRTLLRCSAVSRRFRGLVPLVHDVFLKIDWRLGPEERGRSLPGQPSSMFVFLLKLILVTIFRSVLYFPDANAGGSKALSPRQVLRNFTHVRNLKIELPPCSLGGAVVTRDGEVLKWRAEFGTTLQSCLILAGSGMAERRPAVAAAASTISQATNGSFLETLFTDTEGGQKLRDTGALCCLLSATTRHYRVLPIIMDHPTIRSLVFTDADGLGTLVMGAEQLEECRENLPLVIPAPGSRCTRTAIPLCTRKTMYCHDLELPEGLGRQKAAIMVIKPAVEGDATTVQEEVEELLVSGTLDGPFVHVARALLKQKATCYIAFA